MNLFLAAIIFISTLSHFVALIFNAKSFSFINHNSMMILEQMFLIIILFYENALFTSIFLKICSWYQNSISELLYTIPSCFSFIIIKVYLIITLTLSVFFF